MLQGRHHASLVLEGGVALETANRGNSHSRYQKWIFPVGLFAAAPARVAGGIHELLRLLLPDAEHLRDLLFQRHAGEKILHPLLRRERRISVGRNPRPSRSTTIGSRRLHRKRFHFAARGHEDPPKKK